jgi:phage terminase large subunit GpA-like protein
MTMTTPTDQRKPPPQTPLARIYQSYASGLQPDALVWTDEWAEANRVMPPDTPEPGPYRNRLTPYLIDIQRTMSPASSYVEGWWQKPVQAGGSVSGENLIATWVCVAAGSIIVTFPTLDDAKQWELTRFEPLRTSTRELRRRIRKAEEKGSDNTKLRKKYPGGVMRLVGANRPIKSVTARYVKCEEPDEYPADVNGQGSVIEMLRARQKNFGRRRKMFGDGTPTLEGQSEICAQAKRGDQRRWLLACPSCGHWQELVQENVKWVDNDPDTVRYQCADAECAALHTEQEWKLRNYAQRTPGMSEPEARAAGLAHWEATADGEPGIASWVGPEAWALPTRWRPWPDLVREWLAAQGSKEMLKAWWNNIRAKPYKDDTRVSVGAEALQQRAESYPLMHVPLGGLVVVASVDTQDNRLAVLIRAWGRGEESWGIWHDEIYGDPSVPRGATDAEGKPSPWTKLDELLAAPIKHESGQMIRVDACAIDEGGHHTEDVRGFCRDQQLRGRHVFPVAGAKPYNAPMLGKPTKVEFTWRGTEVPGGILLRKIGTQLIKHKIDGRLKLSKPGGGYYHFPLGFTADYYTQLRAEETRWQRDTKGRKELWWMNPKGHRNEAWDLETYNYAGLLYCMAGRHTENVWRDREKLYGRVQQLDLLMPATDQPITVPSTDAPADVQTSAHDTDEAADMTAISADDLAGPTPADLVAQQQLAARRKNPPLQRPRRGFAQRW